MRRRFFFVAALLAGSAALAGPVIDHSADRGYILSMPLAKGSAFRRVGLIVALPGKGMSAKLERDNWAFAAEQNGFALVNLEVDYSQMLQPAAVDALHDRIQTVIAEVEAEQPSIEKAPAFIAGTSRGGMTAITLALRHPGAYAAVGAAAGAQLIFVSGSDVDHARGQSFFFVQGSEDKTVPFEKFDEAAGLLKLKGGHVETFIHKGAGHILDKDDYKRIVKWMAYHVGKRSPTK